MSKLILNALITKALVDKSFKDLLLSDPREALNEFNLTTQERVAVIEAVKESSSIDQVIELLENWISENY